MAAPTHGSAVVTSGVGPNVASIAVTVPSGVAADSVVTIFVYHDPPSLTFTWPSGFSEIAAAQSTVAGKTFGIRCAVKRATGGDTGTYTVTPSSSTNTWIEALSVRTEGVRSSGNVYDGVTSGGLSVSGTTGASLSFTGLPVDQLIYYFSGVFDAKNQVDPDAGGTTWLEAADSNDDVAAFYRDFSAGGDTGTFAPTWTTATGQAGIAISFSAVPVTPPVAVPLGMFDPDLVASSWFDPGITSLGSFLYGPYENEFIGAPAAAATSDVPLPTMIPMALLAM